MVEKTIKLVEARRATVLVLVQSTYLARVSPGRIGPRATVTNWCLSMVVRHICSAIS